MSLNSLGNCIMYFLLSESVAMFLHFCMEIVAKGCEALVGTLDLHPIRLDHRLREGRRRESVVGDMRRKNEDMRGEQEGSEEALTASNSILISPPPSPRLLSTTRRTKSSNL